MDESASDRSAGTGDDFGNRTAELEEFRRLVDEPPGRREARLAALSAAADGLAGRLRRLLDSVAEELEVRDHETADPNLGRRIGRFRLERLLGRGASARVYLATAFANGVEGEPGEVALKLFDRSDLGPGFRRRLSREIAALRRIEHPGVVRFVEEGLDGPDGRPWLAMEFVPDACGIVDRVAATAASLEERAGLVGQMREALAAAHAAGVVHRDLSPRNVLVDRDGRVKIVDFGIASIVQESVSPHGTASGTLVGGTPVTMAPEQVDRSFGAIGPWTDEYAAAAIAYRIFTGRYPYDTSGSLASVAQAIVHVPPRPVRELEPGVPEGLAAWIGAGLVKEAEGRRRALSGPSRCRGPKRRWLKVAGFPAAIITAAFVVRGVLWRSGPDREEIALSIMSGYQEEDPMAARCWIGTGLAATAMFAHPASADTLATLTATMTADNTFTAFVSNSPSTPGTVLCQNDVPWLWSVLRTGSYAFNTPGTYYVHVAAHDVDFPGQGMLIAGLILQGNAAAFSNGQQSLVTDTQHWMVSRDALGVAPEPPISRGYNSDGVWGGFPQLPGTAQFLWSGVNDQDIWFTTVITIGQPDCDGDGVSDATEIAQGGGDLNGNAIPDECECLADLDATGSVNGIDLAIVLGVWGTVGGKYPQADINQDGVVNALDLAVVLSGWGPCP